MYVHPATVSSVVNFANCGEITDAGLRELAQHCHQLSSVDFAGCVKITDAGLRELGQHRHQLISVNFGVAFRFNDLHYVCTLLHPVLADLKAERLASSEVSNSLLISANACWSNL